MVEESAHAFPRRVAILSVCLGISLLAFWLVFPLEAQGSPLRETQPAGLSQTDASMNDPFTATLSVTPHALTLQPGDLLTVTMSLEIAQGCQYPVYELQLLEMGDDPPLFSYVDPPNSLVGPPVPMPFSFVLRAEQPGFASFQALTYGERNCNDFWNWRTLSGQSVTVTVGERPHRIMLPTIAGGLTP